MPCLPSFKDATENDQEQVCKEVHSAFPKLSTVQVKQRKMILFAGTGGSGTAMCRHCLTNLGMKRWKGLWELKKKCINIFSCCMTETVCNANLIPTKREWMLNVCVSGVSTFEVGSRVCTRSRHNFALHSSELHSVAAKMTDKSWQLVSRREKNEYGSKT